MLLREDLDFEANKCLLCKNARCQKNCPINTEIPKIIELYRNNEMEKAGEILFKNNPLSLVCSIVCYHKEQCFGNCILNFKGNAVEFYKIEREISYNYLYNRKFERTSNINKRVAIIGGGPSGISMAFMLAELGYNITIFEKNEKLGGVLRYGIPEFRLDRSILDKIEESLLNLDVKIRYNVLIGSSITISKLFNDGYDAIFIGTGAWRAKSLNVKGETFGHVHYAIDYLMSPNSYKLGKKVIIIGGGNVSMDSARSAKRNGLDVTIVYRKGFEDMPASVDEIDDAKKDGVKFEFFKSPIEINDNGVSFCEVEKIIDENGKIKFINRENNIINMEADSVIIAISQEPNDNIISTCNEIKVSDKGLIICDENGNTTMRGVFAGGDVVTGPKTVVDAVNNCKIVSESIHKYLTSSKC